MKNAVERKAFSIFKYADFKIIYRIVLTLIESIFIFCLYHFACSLFLRVTLRSRWLACLNFFDKQAYKAQNRLRIVYLKMKLHDNCVLQKDNFVDEVGI